MLLGPINVNLCELSYINHIEKEVGWSELGEIDKTFSVLRPREPGSFLPAPETIAFKLRYKLPHGRGRLHAELTPVLRGRDLQTVLRLGLTVRGSPTSGSDEDIKAWFNLAHEWIVRAFAELTSPEAHTLWGRKS